jgi:transcriptional regulator with XRE-family HTH domain
MSELGDTIRSARQAKGLSQADLARHFGVSTSAVNQWESGKNIPKLRNAAALAEKLELDATLMVRLASLDRGRIPRAPAYGW